MKISKYFRMVTCLTLLLITAGCGGSEGSSDSAALDSKDKLTPDLPSIQKLIFTPKCALENCHLTRMKSSNYLELRDGQSYENLYIALSTYEIGTRRAGRVTPYLPQHSYLLMKLTGDKRIIGDVMPPSGYSRLSDFEIGTISTWIANGAKEEPEEE